MYLILTGKAAGMCIPYQLDDAECIDAKEAVRIVNEHNARQAELEQKFPMDAPKGWAWGGPDAPGAIEQIDGLGLTGWIHPLPGCFAPALLPKPRATTPANMADILSGMDPEKLRQALAPAPPEEILAEVERLRGRNAQLKRALGRAMELCAAAHCGPMELDALRTLLSEVTP